MNGPKLTTPWGGAQEASFLKTIFDALPGAIGYWDAHLFCRYANKAFFEWFGKLPEAVLGTHYRDLVNEQFYQANKPYIEVALTGQKVSYERTLPMPDGGVRFLFVNYIPDFDSAGSVSGFFVQVNDVTQIKQAEAQIEVGAAVFGATADGIMVTDNDSTILSVNPAFTEITGYSAAEAVGRTPRMFRSDRQPPEFYQVLWSELTTSGRWQGEIWNRRKNGETCLQRQTITRIRSASGSIRYVAVFSDITELWHTSERIRHLAFHDELTDLPNRAILIDRLAAAIDGARTDPSRLAVMFIDLDGFKDVNDRFGHDAGDTLLKTIAKQLQLLMRRTDMVARVGGDEFVALILNIESEEPVARIARSMIKAINEPLHMNDGTARVGVSIGIAMYPTGGRTAADLMREADAAMYAVKSHGKNSYQFAGPAKAEAEPVVARRVKPSGSAPPSRRR